VEHAVDCVREEAVAAEASGAQPLPSPLADVVRQSDRVKKRRQGSRNPGRSTTRRTRRSSRPQPTPVSPGAVVLGTLAGIDDAGRPLVRHWLLPDGGLVVARSAISLDDNHVGSEVVVAFEQGDLRRPIILGRLWQPGSDSHPTPAGPTVRTRAPIETREDGEQLLLEANQQIVLRCGDASITLTRSGKVLIRGAYLLSRSSGINRIKGGAVQIN
jgi:hypothetical protein